MKWKCLKYDWLAILLVSLLLVNCGGGGGDDSGNNPPTTNSITVVPSLGKITGATVNVYKADNSTLLSHGSLDSSGIVVLDFQNYTGPVVIEVVGSVSAQYFDEASNALLAFGADKKIHAIAPTSNGTFAVTLLTELAYQKAFSSSTFPLDASAINEFNERIRKAIVPEIANLLTAPTLFDENTSSGSLGNDDAGKYALKLAALAQMSQGDATPALSMMEALKKDMGDGNLDGKDASDNSYVAPYSDFKSELEEKLTVEANRYANDDLKNEIGSYPPIDPFIPDPEPIVGNGEGGTATISNAPTSVATSFSPDKGVIFSGDSNPGVVWRSGSDSLILTTIGNSDDIGTISLTNAEYYWICDNVTEPRIFSRCNGALVNRNEGTLTLTNVVLSNSARTVSDITFNGTLKFDGAVNSDTTAPTVTSVSPVDGANDVSVNTTITATFSEAINSDTIDNTTFTVSGVTGTVSYNSSTKTATFTPDAPLAPNTTYSATIVSNVQDLAGNALEVKEWSFMTVDISVVSTSSGILDTTFGNNGKVIVTGLMGVDDVMQQADNKILVLGRESTTTDSDVYLARYFGDGTLDTSFGVNGLAFVPMHRFDGIGRKIREQSNGSIIVIGKAIGSNKITALVRYNNDGMIDNNFGNEGIVTSKTPSIYQGVGIDLSFQSDGKYLFAEASNTGSEFTLNRYLIDGSADTSFGSEGTVTSFQGAFGSGIVIQSDGKIITNYNSEGVARGFARYDTNGSLDSSFGKNGIVDVGNDSLVFYTNQGKIIVAAHGLSDGTADDYLIRYLEDGSLDTNFGNNGRVMLSSKEFPYFSNIVFFQNDNKTIVLSGYPIRDGYRFVIGYDYWITRYKNDGSLDIEFADAGNLDLPQADYRQVAVTLQNDDKILFVAEHDNVVTISRYLP